MPARLTLYPAHGVSRAFVYREGRNHFAGRDPVSEICIDDPRVSARHALLQWSRGTWMLVDLRSKNGTYVNGARITEVPLQSGDWISFGGLLARHERVSDAEIERLEGERVRRLQTLADGRRAVEAGTGGDELWTMLLPAALELSGAARGFVAVFGRGQRAGAQVASGFAPFEPVDDRFDEVFAAIRSILETGSPAVVSRRRETPEGRRRSTREDVGASPLAAVPLRRGEHVAGVLCVEGKRGDTISDLDLEILEGLAESASAVLGRSSDAPRVREPAGARETAPGVGHPFLEQLGRRLADVVRAARETTPSEP